MLLFGLVEAVFAGSCATSFSQELLPRTRSPDTLGVSSGTISSEAYPCALAIMHAHGAGVDTALDAHALRGPQQQYVHTIERAAQMLVAGDYAQRADWPRPT